MSQNRPPARGSAFMRRRSARIASGALSIGVLAGMTLFTAAPASAATDADCLPGNTVDATALPTPGTAADIQILLSADTPIICLIGTFTVTSTLQYDHTVTLYGLSAAVLDGGGTQRILLGSVADDITVENLRLTGGLGGDGSAILGTNVTVRNSVVDHNSGTWGGAVLGDVVVIDGSTFEDNSGSQGGSVMGMNSATVTSSEFYRNHGNWGGAIQTYGVLTVDDSTFADNTASTFGGAIAVDSSAATTITNSTFVGNRANGEGAAAYFRNGTVVNSTFLDNYSGGVLGGSVRASTSLGLRGNIFAGTTNATAHIVGDGVSDLGGNVFSTLAVTEDTIPVPDASTQFNVPPAALFATGALADNGGEVPTLALSATSPAIDAVPVGVPATTLDARGETRGALSDAGAYEFIAPVIPAGPDAPTLPPTGSTPSWLGGLATALLAAGALALGGLSFVRRQTRRTTSRS